MDDLRRIPLLTKQKLRAGWWDFLPRELPACRVSRTSGSTGVPVCILSDNNSRLYNSAAVIRYRRALGMKLSGGAILTPLKNKAQPTPPPHWTFLQGIHKTYYINPYLHTPENIKYAHQLLNRLKQPALIGITPAIRTLACKVKDGLFPPFKPAIVITSGQCLEPEIRELIESTMNANVADIYACNEAGDVAWQCRNARAYHINADNVIVEIVKNTKVVEPGEPGEVVITNLNRYCMPVIRYKNGDLARMATGQCPCGCRLPMLEEIIGRTGDNINLPNGTNIPWNQLKGVMNHPCIRQFQLVQNRKGCLTIRYVPEKNIDTVSLERLMLERFDKLLGSAVCVYTENVEKIEPAPSGKSRLVVSYYHPGQ